jgi:hypothetical protein
LCTNIAFLQNRIVGSASVLLAQSGKGTLDRGCLVGKPPVRAMTNARAECPDPGLRVIARGRCARRNATRCTCASDSDSDSDSDSACIVPGELNCLSGSLPVRLRSVYLCEASTASGSHARESRLIHLRCGQHELSTKSVHNSVHNSSEGVQRIDRRHCRDTGSSRRPRNC